MPAQVPYIPVRDSILVNWATNFRDLTTATPGTYGLLAGEAAAIAAGINPFLAAYPIAVNPGTRTSVTVLAKDTAKINLWTLIRPFAMIIKANVGVAQQDKEDLGLHVDSASLTPIIAPVTTPLLVVVAATPFVHTVRYADSNSPASRAKPFGALHLQLFNSLTADDDAPPAINTFKLVGSYTKQPLPVVYDQPDAAMRAWYRGRWATRTGLVGNWGELTSFTVAS